MSVFFKQVWHFFLLTKQYLDDAARWCKLKYMLNLCISGIWWSHCWTWHFERGFLQRQHPDHATTKGQPDCEFQAPCCFCFWLFHKYYLQRFIMFFSVPSCGHQKTRQMRERPETGKTNGIALLIHLHSYLKHRQLIYIPLHSISSSHFCMTSSLNCSWPTSSPLSVHCEVTG